MNGLSRRLESPVLGHGLLCALLLAGVAHQLVEEYYTPYFSIDKAYQTAAARTLLEYGSLAIPLADPSDLSAVEEVPLIGWPPGYSLLLAPFLVLTKSPVWSGYIVDCLAGLLFFVSWFVVLGELGPPVSMLAKLTLLGYWSIVYSPLFPLSSSGQLALALFSAAMAVALLGLRALRVSPWLLGASCTLLFGASGLVRYAYWPLLGVLPATLLLVGLWRRGAWLRAAVSSAAVAATMLALLGLLGRATTGHATYLSSYYGEPASLHWENVLLARPALQEGFGFRRGWRLVVHAFGLPESYYSLGLWCASLIGVAALLAGAAASLSRVRRSPPDRSELAECFCSIAGCLTYGITVSMLVYLSVRYPASEGVGSPWVYVAEPRYLAPAYPFAFLSLILLAGKLAGRRTVEWASLLGLASALLIAGAIVTVGYWRVARWIEIGTSRAHGRSSYSERLFRALDGQPIVDALDEALRSGRPVVYLEPSGREHGPAKSRRALAAMSGALILDVPLEPDLSGLGASREVVVLAAVERGRHPESARRVDAFVARHGGVELAGSADVELFQVVVGSTQRSRRRPFEEVP